MNTQGKQRKGWEFCLFWAQVDSPAALVIMGKSGKSGRITCLGDRKTKKKCNKTVRTWCPDCGDYRRCKDHCSCKNTTNAEGRKAPRPARGAESAIPLAQPAVAAPVMPAAIGRPANLSVEVFTDSSWIDSAIKEVLGAKNVLLASYVYSNSKVQEVLSRRLRGKSDFKCVLAVDKSAYHGTVAPGEKTKLRDLKSLGAAVYLCNGIKGKGIFHWKCLIVDSRVAYTGSANATQGCLNNWEL
eukprot:7749789-Karenia_brevis.AAC.1